MITFITIIVLLYLIGLGIFISIIVNKEPLIYGLLVFLGSPIIIPILIGALMNKLNGDFDE